MADETTPTPVPTPPQTQPGPSRTPDGTIIDASATSQTPPATSTPTDSSTPATTKPGDVPAAPEKYEAFTVPDGFKLDDKVNGEASAIFKELNLPQASAQKLVDFYVKETQSAIEAPFKAFATMVDGWKGEVSKAYGAKIEPGGEHALAVSRLLSQLGPAEAPFREAMDATGVGSHPAFVSAFIKLASMLGEGSDIRGNGPSPLGQTAGGDAAKPTAAQAMYPHLPSAGR